MDIDLNITQVTSLIDKSLITEAFIPTRPIPSNLFCGRTEQLKEIANGLNSGMSIVLYGDRGVGKTSLAKKIEHIYGKELSKEVKYIQCSAEDTFSTIMMRILQQCGISCPDYINERTQAGVEKIVQIGRSTETLTNMCNDYDNTGWVAKQLKDWSGLLIIDEFDLLTYKPDKDKFTHLIKHLSDESIDIHFLLVGIASNIEELLSAHGSADRLLGYVYLKRMTDTELFEIINTGEEKCGSLKFDYDVKTEIVKMSLGFPYFTHLIALESAKVAVLNYRQCVTYYDMREGIGHAFNLIECGLKDKCEKTVGKSRGEKMEHFLYSAACVGQYGVFDKKTWFETYNKQNDEQMKMSDFNNAIKKIVKGGSEGIIRRVDRGVYEFTDSRMPCYIEMRHKRI